ncbi:dTDP-4-dehydrorhamnose 3,5-epimerase [Sulfitobacter sabulilitoris]|uniref:dTDP-4-dehydrorhamnose 3,5-epimerase n=1 Tax=Sulfitobacter sabulilitoris TaxID=2562655 RepID=A0A5S3PD80_9RHOB|nr:dTDP-4-dehydrorhamnose 3,5-epimerase [Sulfitobacter sabulilitoris]TMM49369.1 dTDP-4-dehydrorhamnose 3,5-epimerase [Sulfitobacter sabulilitoris]
MQVEQTSLSGVLILTPRRIGDDRGFFSETWNRDTMLGIGIDIAFVQDNHSLSREAGVVRGLHYQAPPHAQDKLVRAGAGAVLDVVVDIRQGSETYGKWTGVELSAENGRQVFIPKGFLHGFVTLRPNSELLYKCSDVYAPDCDGSVYFADPDLGINWGIDPARAILSPKDRNAPRFADFKSPFRYKE